LAAWTLAYEAPPANWLGTAMPIQDRAKNVLECVLGQRELRGLPLVFVCHSLGGLVVKQALRAADGRRAYGDPEAKAFLDSVKGIVFIATPHTGSIQATLLDKLRLIAWPSASTVDLVKNMPTCVSSTFGTEIGRALFATRSSLRSKEPLSGLSLETTAAIPDCCM
jgi:hypothetical protein